MVDIETQILNQLDKIMDDLVDEIFTECQQKLIDDGKIDTGNIIKTANINRSFLEKEIIFPAIYADVIEFGRNPGSFVPIAPLERWVRRKLRITNEKKAKSVAFAISKSIKERGIQASPYVEPSLFKIVIKYGG